MTNSHHLYELIDLCIRGNHQATEQLFRTYAGKMMTVCRRYAPTTELAEDWLQEGFVKVFTNLHKFERQGSFEGWIRKIFINHALRELTKNPPINEDLDQVISIGTEEQDPLSKLNEEHILSLVQALPDGYRAVFNLFVIEGYSHKEISEMLEIEESTSRSQLVKARKMLQEKLSTNNKLAV